MRTLRRQAGASLLIILLIMAGVGSVVLAGSKAIIDSSRQASTTSFSTSALQIAQTGIQDGLLLYKKGFLTASGEYGDPAGSTGTNYSLQNVRRGFQLNDATCSSFTVDQVQSATYNQDCPYYELSIRNVEAFSSAASAASYQLTSRELPKGVGTIIPLPVNPGITLTFNTNGGIGLTYDYSTCTTLNCQAGSESATTLGVSNSLLAINAGVLAVRITPHFTPSAGPHVQIVQAVAPTGSWGTSQIAVGKGFTTIDVTGYAGGVQKKLILTVRPHDRLTLNSTEVNPSYNQLDFAQSFDQYGVLIP